MGEVYLAQHPTLNRPVAVKILPSRTETDDAARKRFQREAQTVARLKHPNIVTLHDVGEEGDQLYMVMEFVDGPDLASLLKGRGRLPLSEALPILQDVASALDYAHSQGVIHRDIKPSNVMVEPIKASESQSGQTRTSRAVLMDFGIAKSYAAGTRLTQSGMIGTLDYISPEQIQGASEVDARADVYSFGVMAYQTLTGELPFKHSNPGAMVMAHLMQPPPDPRDLVPELPRQAAQAVMQAMAKKPDERFRSAGKTVLAMA
jgi:serine/threonine protein kinase